VTDRIKGLYVVLEYDIREDDAQPLIEAIKMLKNVLEVKTEVSTSDDWLAYIRAKNDLRGKIVQILVDN